MKPIPRRTFLHAAAASVISAPWLLAAPAGAQGGFPARPVRIVVPFPPGGGSDILARLVAERLQAAWGQSVVVDNRAGAGGTVGADHVAKSAPDGHTLLVADAAVVTTSPALRPDLPYRSQDLLPVVNLATFGLILVVPTASPLRSLRDLLAMDKAAVAKLNAASSGNGTGNHLALEKFKQATGLPLAHVPYKGASQAVNDVVGGHADLMFTSGPLAQPLFASGRLRALAVTTAQRMPLVPDVPTVAEAGFPGFEWAAAQGMFAPAGTPAAAVQRINADVRAAIRLPELRARWDTMALMAADQSPAEFAAWVQRETADAAALIRTARITLQ